MNSSMVNSQAEKLEIKQISKGEFSGQHVLIIHDDPEVSNTKALHLFDYETRIWLQNILHEMDMSDVEMFSKSEGL